jgi:hypothetical protein
LALGRLDVLDDRKEVRPPEAFDGEFAELVSAVEASTCLKDSKGENTKDRRLALEWLTTLSTRREQWAARWTWAVLTLDVHSTQRAEATHSALAHIIANSDKLQKLLDKLNLFEQNSSMLKFKKAERLALIQVGPALRPHGRARECAAERARARGLRARASLGMGQSLGTAPRARARAPCSAPRAAGPVALEPARARSSLLVRARACTHAPLGSGRVIAPWLRAREAFRARPSLRARQLPAI